MGWCQGMVQMTEMGDAQTGDVEHKNRVTIVADAAEFAYIGRNVVDANIAVLEAMGRNASRGVPAAQYIFDPRFDCVAVMRRMSVVHRHNIGRQRRPNRVVVIRHDPNAGRALYQKARMAKKGDRDRFLGAGSREAQRRSGYEAGTP